MGGNKQANKKKQDQQQKKQVEPDTTASNRPKSSPKQKKGNKSQNEKGCGWSCLGKLNLLLLLAAATLAGRALFLHADGDLSEPGLERARARLAASWATLSALSREHGGAALQWAGEKADRVDAYLLDTQLKPYWVPVKQGAGRAWNVTSHYGAIAGERALIVGAQVLGKTYEVASAGWEKAKPHCEAAWKVVSPYYDAALVAAKPHWDTATAAAARGWNATATAAGPLWEAAAAQGTAVKAGVLSAAGRLQRDGGPVLAEWAAAAQRGAGDAWEAVQREGPKYAAATGRWMAQTWDYVSTEGPVYAKAAVEKVKQAVSGLTGSA